jgi:peptidoglycan DL-endopeptidase CwlO
VRDGVRRPRAVLWVPVAVGMRRLRAALRVAVTTGRRRLRAALWVAVAVGIVAGISPRLINAAFPGPRGHRGSAAAPGAGGAPLGAARSQPRASGSQEAGTFIPAALGGRGATVPVAQLAANSVPVVAPLSRLLAADLLVVAPTTLPQTSLRAVRRLRGVVATDPVDAARIKLDGSFVAMLGVDPSRFRAFAARPTARSNALWQSVADGDVAVSYLMGEQERLPLGGTVDVAGARTEKLRVGGFGTVGISGVDAVVSTRAAQSLGLPADNSIVISAPHASLSALEDEIARVLPRNASVVPLVAQPAVQLPVAPGSAGGVGVTAADGPGLTPQQTRAFLAAAESRLGMPYVWGDAGPYDFDCSGLVQWSMRQAGITMPRVAVDQAMTGPLIPLTELQPGDLLFYHTDPTAPEYISHVAIYLGDDEMEQAPEPGMDVEIVPAVFDGGFAGAVEVYPRVAAAVAAEFSSG